MYSRRIMNGKVFHHILQRLRPGEGDIKSFVKETWLNTSIWQFRAYLMIMVVNPKGNVDKKLTKLVYINAPEST